MYNVYDTCGNDQVTVLEQFVEVPGKGYMPRFMDPEYMAAHKSDWRSNGAGQSLNGYKCGGEKAMGMYLANQDVIKAIHVKTDVPHFNFNCEYTKKCAVGVTPRSTVFVASHRSISMVFICQTRAMSRRCCQHTQASLTSTGSSSVRLRFVWHPLRSTTHSSTHIAVSPHNRLGQC